MKRRLLSMVLALVMVFTLLPTVALADEETGVDVPEWVTDALPDGTYTYAEADGTKILTITAEGTEVQLQKTLDVPENLTLTLDLNGHTLKDKDDAVSAVSIANGVTLTVTSTGGAGAILCEAENLQCDAICNVSGTANVLIGENVTVQGCNGGDGVYIKEGSITVSGTARGGNATGGNGGNGACVSGNGTITVKDGGKVEGGAAIIDTSSNNTGKSGGAGAYVNSGENSSIVVESGGTAIGGNSACPYGCAGDGVYNGSSGETSISGTAKGGDATGEACDGGHGVSAGSGSITVSGTATGGNATDDTGGDGVSSDSGRITVSGTAKGGNGRSGGNGAESQSGSITVSGTVVGGEGIGKGGDGASITTYDENETSGILVGQNGKAKGGNATGDWGIGGIGVNTVKRTIAVLGTAIGGNGKNEIGKGAVSEYGEIAQIGTDDDELITLNGVSIEKNGLLNDNIIDGSHHAGTVTANAMTLTYGDVGKMLSFEANGDGEKTYDITAGNNVISVSPDGTVTANKKGEATVRLSVVRTVNYSAAEGELTVTVGAKPVTIDPNSMTITVGDPIPEFALRYTGLVGSDTLTPTPTPEFTCYRATDVDHTTEVTPTEAGRYTIVWTNMAGTTFDGAENYSITPCATGELTVSNRPSGGGGGSSAPDTVNDKAEDDIQSARSGETVDMTLPTYDTTVEKKVLEALQGQNNTLKITSGEVVWTLNGKDIPAGADLKNLDLGVQVNANVIPASALNTVAGTGADGKDTVQLSLNHNGPFGFWMTMEVNLGSANAGLYANLYKYLPESGTMSFRGAFKIGTNGKALLRFNGASDYAVVIDTAAHQRTNPQTGIENPFSDVKESDYFFEPVMWAVDKEITSGTSATTFSPAENCTRAQAVTFLWRAAGKPVVNYAMPFTDVPADAYYTEAVRWAVSEGITGGTSATNFSPDDTCTRGQIAAFLYRFAGSPAVGGEMSFADVSSDAYYADAVVWAKENEITSGTSATTFSPNDKCTRGQIVTFLFRLFNK